jgi:hypothetical protein
MHFTLFLQIFQANDAVEYLETTDENKCNWMMFVRAAESYLEQNIVVYQHGYSLYFTVTKDIEAKQELKVSGPPKSGAQQVNGVVCVVEKYYVLDLDIKNAEKV